MLERHGSLGTRRRQHGDMYGSTVPTSPLAFAELPQSLLNRGVRGTGVRRSLVLTVVKDTGDTFKLGIATGDSFGRLALDGCQLT